MYSIPVEFSAITKRLLRRSSTPRIRCDGGRTRDTRVPSGRGFSRDELPAAKCVSYARGNRYAVTSRRCSERQSRLRDAVSSYRRWSFRSDSAARSASGSSEHRFDELRLRVVREYDEMYTDPRRPYRRGRANTYERDGSRFVTRLASARLTPRHSVENARSSTARVILDGVSLFEVSSFDSPLSGGK